MKSNTKPLKEKRTFKSAIEAIPAVAHKYQGGLQGLKPPHRQKLKSGNIARGSIDLDAALETSYPNDPRWDYGIGLPYQENEEQVLWLEPHHASSGQAKRVVNKLKALKAWLQSHAPALSRMHRHFVWQTTNNVSQADTKQRFALAEQAGIKVRQGYLDLASFK